MGADGILDFTGERIVPGAENCEPLFAQKMYQEHIARYIFAAQLCEGKSVLDVGCGVGYGSQLLGQKGAKSVAAFDLSGDAIRHAQEEYSHPNVRFYVDNAEDFHIEEKVDVVVCFELIEHVERQRQVFQRIQRALKPDGVVIMSTPRALPEKRTDFHTHEFSLGEFEGLFLDFFADVKMYYENNHFASLVTDHKPDLVDNIVALNDQFSLAQADYFIAVAKMSAKTVLPQLKPALTVNDDAYVLLQERDVAILHRAEDDLKDHLNVLRGEKMAQTERISALLGDVQKVNIALEASETRRNQIEEKSRARISELEAQLDAVRQASEERIAGLEADAATRVSELEAQLDVERHSAEDQIALIEAEAADRLAEIEKRLESERDEANQRFRNMLAERNALVADLQGKLESERKATEAHTQEIQVSSQARLADTEHRLQDALATARTTAQQLAALKTETAARLDGAAYELAEARRSESSTARQLAEVQQRVTDLHGIIKEIRQSTSWKVTGPLRSLSQLAGAPKHTLRVMRHYRSIYGTKALLGAIGRKLTGRPVEVKQHESIDYTPVPLQVPTLQPAVAQAPAQAPATQVPEASNLTSSC
jgi:SAM-dependent methyltransferase